MANMSYCRFQNTCTDLQDCVDAMEEAIDIPGMDLSRDEESSMNDMYQLAQRFVEEFDRLKAASTTDNLGE